MFNKTAMRVVSKRTLREFWQKHSDAKVSLIMWWHIIKKGTFLTPDAFRRAFRACDFVGENRIVFNIGGNKYRLVAAIHYQTQTAYVKGVFTHAEYDKIDVRTVDMRRRG